MSLERIHLFFEKPKGFFAKSVSIFLIALIFISVITVALEIYLHEFVVENQLYFNYLELFITIVFSFEYLLRLISSPNKRKFPFQLYNVIDLIAIVPFFIGAHHSAAVRALRLLRLFKLFRYSSLFKAFRYQGTIFQNITPVIIIMTSIKAVIWYLEYHSWWFARQNLGDLFAIIGFALGIILSQKIGVAYDKYIQVENALIRIHGTLSSLSLIFKNHEQSHQVKTCGLWLDTFLDEFCNEQRADAKFSQRSADLYMAIKNCEKEPSELAILHGDLTRDAIFCLSKNKLLTPKAYDNLLQQSTIIYLLLICLFIPGLGGMISAFMATYMLYGMYHVTLDFDTLMGSSFNLINLDVEDLQCLALEFHEMADQAR